MALQSHFFGSVEIQWGQPYILAIPGRDERRPSESPLSVSAVSAVSCREGTKGPAAGNKSPMTYCQNVKTAPARTAQTGAGREQDGNARTSRAQGCAG